MTDTPELEAEIEDDVVIFATNRGWLVRKMIYPGRRGCPDRWFFKNGRLVIMEMKRPDGTLSGNQKREIERFAAVGWTIHVVSDRDTACMLLEGTCYVRD